MAGPIPPAHVAATRIAVVDQPEGSVLPRNILFVTPIAPTVTQNSRPVAKQAMRRIRTAAYNVISGTGKLAVSIRGGGSKLQLEIYTDIVRRSAMLTPNHAVQGGLSGPSRGPLARGPWLG
jgi:hypothetical protein